MTRDANPRRRWMTGLALAAGLLVSLGCFYVGLLEAGPAPGKYTPEEAAAFRHAPRALENALEAEQARARAEATGDVTQAETAVAALQYEPRTHYTLFATKVASGLKSSLQDDQAAIRATANQMNIDLATASPEDVARVRQQVREGWVASLDAMISNPPPDKPGAVAILQAEKCALVTVSRLPDGSLPPGMQRYADQCR